MRIIVAKTQENENTNAVGLILLVNMYFVLRTSRLLH